MPNTFLNTGRTITATSNPVENVNQVSNNPVNQIQQTTQPIQNSQSQTQQNASAMNPITIPIQIQPQIASAAPVQDSNNIQALQTNNVQQTRTNAAPTPQTYNANNTNSNVVDFNQIYSSYQSQYGNNNQSTNNIGTSGIKKTSLGSTIVTPTTSNLNSVQGQYQSAYADTVNSLISSLITQVEDLENGNFYDPSKDTALQMAAEYAANATMENMISGGILNSSMTAERVARVVSELIPQYEQLAYDRQYQYLNQLASTAQLVMNYDSQQFEYWKDAKDREFQEKQFEYQKEQNELENAWKRVDELGYVDNEAAAILGVKAGTLSGEARLAKEQQEFELAKMREQLEIQRANDEALYKLRAELDKEYANYTSQLDRQNAEYEYQLASRYGSSSSGGSGSSSGSSNYTSLSTYQDIINNRWGNQDLVSGQYTVSDNDAVYEYITSEYLAGRMSYDDLANLKTYYGITAPNSSSSGTNMFNTTRNLISSLRS